ncbi:MAG: zinc-binding dehydrogenase [Chloroflexaceae bacterium]|nr:zinc-binding dehydrogenase [Chloroflexaceae bacterium]
MMYQRIVISQTGGPDVLQMGEAPLPAPAHGEVRVRVLAAGVAFADLLARKGKYPGAPALPFTPGYDLVGIVDAVSDTGSAFQPGQMVAALLPHFGGYTEMACVPEAWLVAVPEGLQPERAVSVVLNYLTAHRLLHHSAKVKSGERILVHSAAGGVGTALLQLGQLAQLEMYGTASRPKHGLVARYGALPIDYRHDDVVERISELTRDGVDAVFDAVGGETLKQSYTVLRRGGRLVSYGFAGVADQGLPAFLASFGRLFVYQFAPDGKQAMFYGSTPTLVTSDPIWYRETLCHLFDLLARGLIDPVVGVVLPLEQAAQAHSRLEQGKVQGKIVLTP